MKLGQTFYALRRKSDGMLMPGFKGRAGGTYINPDKPDTHNGTPRLFANPKAAGDALRWWVKGMVRMTGGFGSQDIFGEENDRVIRESVPVAGRSADDWEVIPVSLLLTREADAVQV